MNTQMNSICLTPSISLIFHMFSLCFNRGQTMLCLENGHQRPVYAPPALKYNTKWVRDLIDTIRWGFGFVQEALITSCIAITSAVVFLWFTGLQNASLVGY